jgi:hypothetical protein
MAHLDDIAYGELCRSAYLVQAHLIKKQYSESLSYENQKRLERFIESFRSYRHPETEKADRVLKLFEQYDVQSIEGHKEILEKWAEFEELDKFVGPSSYQRRNSEYILPWP